MDARLVSDTWRRILTDDRLVERVLHDVHTGDAFGLTPAELAILADYARTPAATNQNLGMYRRGLVRNALAALTLVPLTRRLLYLSGLDVDTVAADFVRSTGYVDDGPHFWRIAGGFIAHMASLPEFAGGPRQDVLALDAAAVALARRLGESGVAVWPEAAAQQYAEAGRCRGGQYARFVANRAAVVASSSCDLTDWIENPDDFDAEQEFEPSTRHWLIFIPAADAAHTYAELSERAARTFNLLSTARLATELSAALEGLPVPEVIEVIEALAELGVVVNDQHA